MGCSDARERMMADSQFGSGATSYSPATWYIGLSSTIPNGDGTGFTEFSGGSYARKAVTNNPTNWPAATTLSGVTIKANGTKITLVDPTGTWGSAAAWGAFLAASGGQPEFFNKLETQITIKVGNTPVEFDAGALALEWKGE